MSLWLYSTPEVSAVDWIPIDEAARLLQCSPNTLRRNETADGRYSAVLGGLIRVWRVRQGLHWHRRYSRSEIRQLIRQATARF